MRKKPGSGTKNQLQSFYIDMLIMLAAPCVMAWYYYGTEALKLLAVSILTAVLCEAACGLLQRSRKTSLSDFNAVFIGAVIALMLPANAPLKLAAVGSAFAVIVAKLPFGGTSGAPFVPAAAGFAFLCVCWPEAVFHYPAVSALTGIVPASGANAVTGSSIASMLQMNNSIRLNQITLFDILSGNIPGPMGTGSILVMLSTAVFILFRRPSSILNSLGYLASCAAMALLFPRVLTGRLSSLVLELCAGSLVFTALYLLPDPATSPHKAAYRLLYGFYAGILCMLLRYFGIYEEGTCFALLIANASWPAVEAIINKCRLRFAKPDNKGKKPSAALESGGALNA